MHEIYQNGKPIGLTFSDREVAKAIARDMQREGAKNVEMRPFKRRNHWYNWRANGRNVASYLASLRPAAPLRRPCDPDRAILIWSEAVQNLIVPETIEATQLPTPGTSPPYHLHINEILS
ncbi:MULTISPECIES: hypothetical protein [Rhizobium]|uniref:Uncharacterized protein n=2 Tax=Rhizobium TaxID=379 RepID=A0A6P1CBW6_RHITR|nr:MULTISPECIES: hypothetical protein [Rhizobium]MBB4244622.1 hypothetical protein [Rhizobium tropici]MBB5595967.1 hypothetical protein [Rhizobium tropici]MBB6488567.1 hypothetical protein [Rhizobium lusitanum]MBB6494962.1 hypothetical protein [Rhizobium tropici]NEV14558.1 hypothetical protein [Rhizobium tropici]